MRTSETCIRLSVSSTLLLTGCGVFSLAPPAEEPPPAVEEEPSTSDEDTVEAPAGSAARTPAVEIDLYLMSQCPYGVQAMDHMIELVGRFHGEVGLNIDYIGNIKFGELSSMHGEREVAGDIDQICGRRAAPSDDHFWRFMTCVNREWREIPKHDAECAAEAGLDLEAFNQCRSGDRGRELLRASFQRSMDKEMVGSPSFVIAGERYNGRRDAAAVTQYICGRFGDAGLSTCDHLPPPPKVTVIALTDKRCGDECDISRAIESLSDFFLELDPTVLDWSEQRAKDLMAEGDLERLPAILFDESVKTDESAFRHMERWLSAAGPYYKVMIQADFDPLAEICDNGIDDTGNGRVDCVDDSCKETMPCRENMPGTLEVFVMSQCPYGAMALLAMREMLDTFKARDLALEIHFIATKTDGDIASLHGPKEVEEDMRWLCAMKYIPKDYMRHIWCRAEAERDDNWEECASKAQAKAIRKCLDSGEGKRLLSGDLKIAEKLGISASPTWIANGRYKFNGVTPADIQENFCKHNTGVSGCEADLSDNTDVASGSCGR